MGLYLGNTRIGNLGQTYSLSSSSGVQSVNEKLPVDGNVTVYGSDTQMSQTDTRKIDEALCCTLSSVIQLSAELSSIENILSTLNDVGNIEEILTEING